MASIDEMDRLRSLEQVTDEDGPPEDDGTPQLVIPGTGTKLSGNVGGKKPTESVFKMNSISLPISGNVQIEKDETIWVAVEVAVDQVGVKNHRMNGEITRVVRTHTAIPLGAPMILDGAPASVLDDAEPEV
jgi:hypothetical protein